MPPTRRYTERTGLSIASSGFRLARRRVNYTPMRSSVRGFGAVTCAARGWGVLVGVALAIAACKASPVAQSPEDRLRAEPSRAAEVRVVGTTLRSARGSFPGMPGATPEVAARGFVGHHGELFGVTDPASELALRDVRGDP